MTTIRELLAPVKADVARVPGRGESAFVGLALPVNASTELWNLREIARTDVPRLVAAIEAVAKVHDSTDAIMNPGRHERLVKVCVGCGTDDGNWQRWPCPTITAVVAALGGEA